MPVRIARSALAPGVPQADLYVTGWHALFVDGLLMPVVVPDQRHDHHAR